MDRVSKAIRSKTMSAIRKRGNRSTEWKLRSALIKAGISGWVLHETAILGCPDFWFDGTRLAIFVDGCFWHGCRKCCRLPKQNASYWRPKITGNITRDRSQTARLKRMGFQVMRVWEHSLANREELTTIVGSIRSLVGRLSRGRRMPNKSPDA